MQKLPVRKQKAPRKKVPMTVFLLCCDGKYAVCQRPRYGLLANLWEFPNVEAQMDDQQMIQQVKSWGCRPLSILKTVKQTHIFTHLEWHMEGVLIECGNAGNLFHWETLQQIQESLAVPTAFQKFFPVL
jgi:A/G-specific adenine glycosylase